MRSLFKLPKIQMAIFLFLIFLSAFWYSPSASKLLTLTLALSSTVISDFMFTKLRRIPPFLLSAGIVSGLIIALLTDPSLPWYIPVLAGVLAMFSKNFFLYPTVLFFTLVMLPEPMTTPYIKKYQVIFVVFVSIISFLISSFFAGDPLITALLLGNIIFFKFL